MSYAWLALCLVGGCWTAQGSTGRGDPGTELITEQPIVAIWAHPSNSSLPDCGGDCDFVKGAYVNWLANAGARSLPIRYDATPEELRPILDQVNGLLLPGGNPSLPEGVRWALKYAKGLNDDGDFFPVWGTCLGWEWMAQTFAGDYPIITVDFDAENFTQPLGLLADAGESRMLSGVPTSLLGKAQVEPLASNAHHKGVSPNDFVESGLDTMFRVMAINADRQGVRTYVSVAEALDYPMYGLQWHPEKSQFDWGLDPDGTPHYVINHSKDAVELSQVLATFFASETRRNGHSFSSISDWEPGMFHNRDVTASGPINGQMYYFHLSESGKTKSALAPTEGQMYDFHLSESGRTTSALAPTTDLRRQRHSQQFGRGVSVEGGRARKMQPPLQQSSSNQHRPLLRGT